MTSFELNWLLCGCNLTKFSFCECHSYRPSIKLEQVSDLLAYESLEACRSDLVDKYKLIVIGDESQSTNESATGGCASHRSQLSTSSLSSLSGTSLNQLIIKSSANGSGRTILRLDSNSSSENPADLILDCKSCSTQNL